MAGIITSTQHEEVKYLRRLSVDAGARREAGLYFIEGQKLTSEALKNGVKLRLAMVTAGPAYDQLATELKKSGVEILEFGEKAFAALSSTPSPQGVILLAEIPRLEAPKASAVKLAVALEKLQDPGNLGTALRSAWACGADVVYLSEGCADAYASKTVRAAAGAQMHLTIEAPSDLGVRLAELKAAGVATVALEPEAKLSLWDAGLSGPVCFVVGSEGQGLSQPLLDACKQSLRIEYPGKAESLNAGVSLSIALFEALRQRKNK